MDNKILTALPTKEGIGRDKNKQVTDWCKCVGMEINVCYDNQIYEGLLISEYLKKEGKIEVLYNNKKYLILKERLLDGNLYGIFNPNKHGYKYSVGELIRNNNKEIKVLKQIRDDKNRKSYLIQCQLCRFPNGELFEYEVSEGNLKAGKGCPCCSKQRLVPDINSVYITNPEYIKYFKNIEDSKNTTIASAKKITFKCPLCNEERLDCMNNISYSGFSCSKCSDGITYPNKFAFNMFEQLGVDFISEYSPSWIKPKRYDFYFRFNDKEYIIEMDGGLGHGKKRYSKESISIEESKIVDNYKDEMAKKHNIKIIRIDCDYGHNDRFEYLKNNILNSELTWLLELNKIDWLRCHEFSCSNRVYESCKLFSSGIKNAREISEIMKMDRSVIIGYLKQGTVLGWCDYYVKEMLENRNKKNAIMLKKKFSKSVICLNNKQTFESSKECERQSVEVFGFRVDRHEISDICNGKKDNYKGLKFKYLN